jgi:hypothetical protein
MEPHMIGVNMPDQANALTNLRIATSLGRLLDSRQIRTVDWIRRTLCPDAGRYMAHVDLAGRANVAVLVG